MASLMMTAVTLLESGGRVAWRNVMVSTEGGECPCLQRAEADPLTQSRNWPGIVLSSWPLEKVWAVT
jgi:hypothetical protein